jgi:lysophospholipase L1-like esterase
MFRPIRVVLVATILAVSAVSQAQTPDPDPARFAEAIESFGQWDQQNAVPAKPVLFVGSSSIRFWSTATAFPGKPVINRGFGGSEISDVIHYFDQVVRPYEPAKIFLYAGDNDIGRGKGPNQVFDDYLEFTGMVESAFPDAKLYYLSIKPSDARWQHWPAMQEANELIREHAALHDNLGFVDLASPLLDDEGQTRNVFVEDGLHLNDFGYALWQQAMLPYLD